MKRLEAQHMFGDPRDEMMILFKDVIEIFNLQNFNHLACVSDFQDCVYRLCSGQIGCTFINDNFVWNTVVSDDFLEETACCTEISSLGEHEVKRSPVAINGPVQIGPLPFDLYIGLVNAP